MRRRKRRTSRAFAFLLIAILAAGSYITIKKFKTARAAAPQSVQAPAPSTPDAAMAEAAAQLKVPEPALLTTRTPTAAPNSASADAPVRPVAAMVNPASAIDTASPVSGGNAMADARNRMESGDAVTARKILNDAMLAGRLDTGDAGTARELIQKLNQDAIFGPRILKNDPFVSAYTVAAGDTASKIARANSISWPFLCRINGISDPLKLRLSQTIKVVRGPFHAVVTKSRFNMDVYLGAPGGPGSLYVRSFLVGLGKNDSTPVGTWIAGTKLHKPDYHSPRGEGIILAGDPKNPLGDWWIGLTGIEGEAVGKKSYGIHGTNDPSSIGKEESMGCIRLHNDDAGLVFELLVEGKSKIVVKE